MKNPMILAVILAIAAFLLLKIASNHLPVASVIYGYLLVLLITWSIIKNKIHIKAQKKYLLLLSLFIIIIVVIDFFSAHFYGMVIDEPAIIETAKNIATKEQALFCESNWDGKDCSFAFLPFGWPFIISLLFKMFGIKTWVAFLTQLLVKIIFIIGVFMLAKIVTRSDRIALLATIIFGTSTIFIHWSQTLNSIISTATLITYIFIYHFQNYKKITALLLLLLTSLIRTETLILLIPLSFAYFKRIDKKTIFTLLLFFFLSSFFLPLIPSYLETQKSFLRNEEEIFGTNIFIENIISESMHWLRGDYFSVTLLVFGLFGIFALWKKEFFTQIVVTIICIIFVYLFWHYSDQRRFFITIIPFISILIASGIFYLAEKVHFKKPITVIFVLLVVGISAGKLINISKELNFESPDYNFSEDLEALIPECYLVMEEPVMAPLFERKATLITVPENSDRCLILVDDGYCNDRSTCKEFKQNNK